MDKAEDRLYFERLGERFDRYISDYDTKQRIRLIFSLIDRFDVSLKGKRIIEIGCGTGRISAAIADAAGELVVLDIGPTLVGTVTAGLGCGGIVGDVLSLPVRDRSFDIVISSECIEHTPAPLSALREIARICKPAGVVCITTPNRLWYPVLRIAQWLGLRKFAGIERWVFPRRAGSVFRDAGFSTIVFSGCHLWPFQVGFSRPLLRLLDRWGRLLYPVMINFGVAASKTPEG